MFEVHECPNLGQKWFCIREPDGSKLQYVRLDQITMVTINENDSGVFDVPNRRVELESKMSLLVIAIQRYYLWLSKSADLGVGVVVSKEAIDESLKDQKEGDEWKGGSFDNL